MPYTNREEKYEYDKHYRITNRESVNRYFSIYRDKNREKLKEYQREYMREYRKIHKSINDKIYHKYRTMLEKVIVIGHYSNGEFKCCCCGEDRIEFLEINHIKGGGNKHRKDIQKNGNSFYHWLIKNNLPNGDFDVMCSNCNGCLGRYGYCAHNETDTYKEKFLTIFENVY